MRKLNKTNLLRYGIHFISFDVFGFLDVIMFRATSSLNKLGRIRKVGRGRVTHGTSYHDEMSHSGIGRQVNQSHGIRRDNIGSYYNLHSNRFNKVQTKTTDGIKRARFYATTNSYYTINFDIDDDDIQSGYTRLEQQQYKVASKTSSVMDYRMPFPMQNRGLSHLNTKNHGKGISVISTIHPAKKTKNHLVDAQKMLSTGIETRDPSKTNYSADSGDNLSDIFQGPGEEAEGSLIPFDARFGATHAKGELKDQPMRYGNIEMVKQSHFMHLTPMQIKKHCKELKEFMTEFYPRKEVFYSSMKNTPEDAKENLYQAMIHEAKIIESQYAERKDKILFPKRLELQLEDFNRKIDARMKDGMKIRPYERRQKEHEIRISYKALK